MKQYLQPSVRVLRLEAATVILAGSGNTSYHTPIGSGGAGQGQARAPQL